MYVHTEKERVEENTASVTMISSWISQGETKSRQILPHRNIL